MSASGHHLSASTIRVWANRHKLEAADTVNNQPVYRASDVYQLVYPN